MTRKILLLKTPEEQERTKPLYREIFPEDTEAFLDFYYKERPKRILAMEEDGQIIAMLHLNPFLLSFFGKEITASYIYAVPTKALLERRKKEALLDSEEDALPENPVLMMKILNKPLFLSYTGYPDESEEELLRRLSGERIHFSDDI